MNACLKIKSSLNTLKLPFSFQVYEKFFIQISTNLSKLHRLSNDTFLINYPTQMSEAVVSCIGFHQDSRECFPSNIYQIWPVVQRKINKGLNKRRVKNERPISWRLIERSPLRFDRRQQITRSINEREKEERARFVSDTKACQQQPVRTRRAKLSRQAVWDHGEATLDPWLRIEPSP